MKNAIVILGGMGPQASARLHTLILKKSAESHAGLPEKFPPILHASMPVPDFVASKTQYREALKVVKDTCESLPLDRASVIGIACNTAHMMLDELKLPTQSFISIIDVVVYELCNLRAARVGVLASPNTIRSGLYSQALQEVGITQVTPTVSELACLSTVIHRVIAGKSRRKDKVTLSSIALRMQQDGADAILLGCTELSLVGLNCAIPVVDSLDTLAGAMLEKFMKKGIMS
jgi:aspartate racemase